MRILKCPSTRAFFAHASEPCYGRSPVAYCPLTIIRRQKQALNRILLCAARRVILKTPPSSPLILPLRAIPLLQPAPAHPPIERTFSPRDANHHRRVILHRTERRVTSA